MSNFSPRGHVLKVTPQSRFNFKITVRKFVYHKYPKKCIISRVDYQCVFCKKTLFISILDGISLMFVWNHVRVVYIMADSVRLLMYLLEVHPKQFSVFIFTETNLTAMLATTKFLGYKNRSRMQERLSQTGLSILCKILSQVSSDISILKKIYFCWILRLLKKELSTYKKSKKLTASWLTT